MKPMRGRAAIYLLIIALAGFAGGGRAAEPAVPAELQYALFTKALTFDRNLKTRCGATLVIGLLYQKRNNASREAMREIRDVAAASPIDRIEGLPLRIVEINVEEAAWPQQVADDSVDILYLMPVRALDVEAITAVARERKLLTLAMEPAYTAQGLSLGLRVHDNRPKFIINLNASEAEGADFSSQLLRLADIIRD